MVQDAYAEGCDPADLFYEYYPKDGCDPGSAYGIRRTWEEQLDKKAIFTLAPGTILFEDCQVSIEFV